MSGHKVIKITTDSQAILTDCESMKDIIDSDKHLALNGLLYRDIKLRACFELTGEWNSLAEKIIKYLRKCSTIERYTEPVRGIMYLFEEEKDISKETWNLIRKEIRCKKNHSPPAELLEYIEKRRQWHVSIGESWYHAEDVEMYGYCGY